MKEESEKLDKLFEILEQEIDNIKISLNGLESSVKERNTIKTMLWFYALARDFKDLASKIKEEI